MSDTNDQPDSATQPSLLVAFVLFGLGSWIAVNGIYQELPLIAQTAPEGYNIFSYATVAISLANVVPASYLLAVSQLSTASRAKADHIAIIAFVGVGGIGFCFLLGKFWDQIYEIGGARHSVPLIGFIFGAGGIDCLTSVLFYPVLQDFEPEAVSAMQLGEAATGLVGALLATVQENTDGYTVSKFFYTLAGLMGLSMAGYWWVYSKRLAVLLQRQVTGGPPSGQSEPPSACEQSKGFEEDPLTTNRLVVFSEDIPYTNGTDAVDGQLPQSPEPSYPRRKKPLSTHVQIWKFLVAQAVLSFLENGLHTTVLPSCFALYPDTQDMVSAAVKGGYGAAALVTILAHFRALNSGIYFLSLIQEYTYRSLLWHSFSNIPLSDNLHSFRRLAAHEPDVVPVQISWMAEGSGEVAPIGPWALSNRQARTRPSVSQYMYLVSLPALRFGPGCILRVLVAFSAAVTYNTDLTLFFGLLLSGVMPINVSLTPPC